MKFFQPTSVGGGGSPVGGSGTVGQVAFWNSTSTISGDNFLFWNNTNKRLGIGTNSPSNTLDVNRAVNGDFLLRVFNSGGSGLGALISTSASSSSQRVLDVGGSSAGGGLTVLANNTVGVGTSSPVSTLTVNGTGFFMGSTTPATGSGVAIEYTSNIGFVYALTGPSTARALYLGGVGGSVGTMQISPEGIVSVIPLNLTGSQATSALRVVQTWNTSGTPTALFVNITDTTSNVSSLFLDFQKASTSQWAVNKNGTIIGNMNGGVADFTSGVGSGAFRVAGVGRENNSLTFGIQSGRTLSTQTGVNILDSGVFNGTSGTPIGVAISPTFNPTSGTATFATLSLSPTINQTGGANGITSAINISPTLTTIASNGSFAAIRISDIDNVNIVVPKTITAGGTTGARTINKISGSVNFAASAGSLVVTNSLVTASSVIMATVATNDLTMSSVQAVPAVGSFTLYPNTPPTAETRVNFWIVN